MKYNVLNDNNAATIVDDADIEQSIQSGQPLPRAIVQAMGKTHNEKYLEYLYPVLYYEQRYIRLDAAQSIFNLNGMKGLEALKEKDNSIDSSDFEKEPSEKAVLTAIIIRIEKGPSGIVQYFLSEEGRDIVKYSILFYYSQGYDYKEEDIRLISTIIREFLNKDTKRIKKVSKSDWNEFVYFALESLWIASEETEVMRQMSEEASVEVVEVIHEILAYKVSNDIKELIALTTIGMQKLYGLELLRSLKGKVGGDAKRAYKKALQFWEVTEEQL